MTSTGPNPPQRPALGPAKPPNLLRSLGQFFGHIVQGVKSGPDGVPPPPAARGEPTQSVVIKHEVDERALPTPQGVVRLRRTVIEEVEMDRPDLPAESAPRVED